MPGSVFQHVCGRFQESVPTPYVCENAEKRPVPVGFRGVTRRRVEQPSAVLRRKPHSLSVPRIRRYAHEVAMRRRLAPTNP